MRTLVKSLGNSYDTICGAENNNSMKNFTEEQKEAVIYESAAGESTPLSAMDGAVINRWNHAAFQTQAEVAKHSQNTRRSNRAMNIKADKNKSHYAENKQTCRAWPET